jgi:hypothetical protein
MRATLWIAASGVLLASGPVHAGPGLVIGHDGQLHVSCPMEDVVGALDVP